MKIRELREAAGLSQQEMAVRLNVNQTAVSQWERGETAPDIGKLPELAVALRVTTDYLLMGLEEDPVVLDNLAQTYYRLVGDKEKAKEYFQKALEYKENQIDTLYFLSLYDEEEGNYKAAAEKLQLALEGRFSPLNYANRGRVEEAYARIKAKM